MSKLDLEALPAIAQRGINPLPWPVLTESVIERPFRPRFPRYLEELEGKTGGDARIHAAFGRGYRVCRFPTD